MHFHFGQSKVQIGNHLFSPIINWLISQMFSPHKKIATFKNTAKTAIIINYFSEGKQRKKGQIIYLFKMNDGRECGQQFKTNKPKPNQTTV
jgi:hypothetical protein